MTAAILGSSGKGAQINFKAMMIEGDNGPIRVHSDRDCPVKQAFGLEMDPKGKGGFKLYSAGDCPKLMQYDGLKMLRQAAADGIEFRGYYRAQIATDNPSGSFRCLLNS